MVKLCFEESLKISVTRVIQYQCTADSVPVVLEGK